MKNHIDIISVIDNKVVGTDVEQGCNECQIVGEIRMTEQKYSIKTLTPQQRALLNEIRKETEAPYRDIIDGIRKYGNDRNKVINYLREIAIVYA